MNMPPVEELIMTPIVAIIVITIVVVDAAIALYMVMQLREVHLGMNSRLDELLEATQKLARAEGFKAGQEDYLDDVRRSGHTLDNNGA